MVSQAAIVRFMNSYLRSADIEDNSRNGTQVNGGSKEVRKIALAVDATTESVRLARRNGADLLIVHHGILWKGLRDSFGTRGKIIALCRKLKVTLYASHLPLDMHPEVGNNIGLARMLDLKDIKPFGSYHNNYIGFCGRMSPVHISSVVRKIDRGLGTCSILLPYGKNIVRSVGIVSGGGSSALIDSYRQKLDLFLIGEAPHHVDVVAKEIRQNVVIAGHYHTETFGVKALGRCLEERFKIKAVFLDLPTRV